MKDIQKLKDAKAFLFDLDGTLLDSMWLWNEVDVRFFQKRGLTLPEGFINHIAVMRLKDAAEDTVKTFSLEETPQQIIEEWLEEGRKLYAERVTCKPFAKDFLRLARSLGKKTAVVTAGEPRLFLPCLQKHGIASGFDEIVTLHHVNRGKDHPDIYLYAAQSLGCMASECVVFEDVPQALQTAKTAGFYTVGILDEVTKEDSQPFADECIVSFEEVYHALQQAYASVET